MNAGKEWFPYSDISETDYALIECALGERPIRDEDRMKDFLRHYADPMFESLPLRMALCCAGAEFTDRYQDIPNRNQGVAAVINGARFYSGMLTTLSKFGSIPCDDGVLEKIEEQDPTRLSWSTYERINDEAPEFCKLANESRLALSASSKTMQQLVLMGAGLIHMVTIDSAKVDSSVESLESEFGDSLADLEAIFRTINGSQ